ncbi:MAG: hypothetical protein EBU31_08575, partial [Proteobacteria bacterium]|nr:hypothetical protein [Pseudomonadota bacterium]
EKAPAFGAYMRTRDGFAPDSEGELRPGMRAPMQGARPGAVRHGAVRHGAVRHGAARQDAPRAGASRPGTLRQESARTGPARPGSARPGAAPHGGGRVDTRRAPTKSKRIAPRPGATRGLVDPTAAESETTGRSLASMIMHAPSAARRNKKRIQKGPAKQKRTANQRGKQRKAPITKACVRSVRCAGTRRGQRSGHRAARSDDHDRHHGLDRGVPRPWQRRMDRNGAPQLHDPLDQHGDRGPARERIRAHRRSPRLGGTGPSGRHAPGARCGQV